MFGLSLNLEIECVLKEPIRFVGKKKSSHIEIFWGHLSTMDDGRAPQNNPRTYICMRF